MENGRPRTPSTLVLALLWGFGSGAVLGAPPALPEITIPRVEAAPRLEDFLDMKPSERWAGRLARVEGLVQRSPRDGEPASQRTEVYLGYDDDNLYAVFVCFDDEPEKVRAHMMRRGSTDLLTDDYVAVQLDTFRDQQRAYGFLTNALGIQLEGIWSEANGSFDLSFDTVYRSTGKLTPKGYVVWIAVPFKSMRFPARAEQTWGILLLRGIPRNNEDSFWPHYSTRIQGRLNQMATLRGIENVSHTWNAELQPYGVFRSFRALDGRDPSRPLRFESPAEASTGLDAKLIYKDSLVLDLAVNPEFSQVESDEPQVTANQRFEVFFPERRPFFLENASFFETPTNLVFSRRIVDPQAGARLTGKVGPWGIGALLMNDDSPGKLAADTDPFGARAGARARFGVLRLTRDLYQQSAAGLIYTERSLGGSANRVAGVDARLKLDPNWVATAQATTSTATSAEGARSEGAAYDVKVARTGRQLGYELHYNDRDPDFVTELGFVPRTDLRRIAQVVDYRFRPGRGKLLSWGPKLSVERLWDHSGTRLDSSFSGEMSWELPGVTVFGVSQDERRERLRPADFPALTASRDFSRDAHAVFFSSEHFSSLLTSARFEWGDSINVVPAPGEPPRQALSRRATVSVSVRPTTSLQLDHSYFYTRLMEKDSGRRIFANHIFRSTTRLQLTRELSLRFIAQIDALHSEREATALETVDVLDLDLLLTYLVHPGTALYVGLTTGEERVGVAPRYLSRDARQFFVKMSYLLRL